MTKKEKVGLGVGLGITSLALFLLWRSSRRKDSPDPALVLPPGTTPAPVIAPVLPEVVTPVGSWFTSCPSSGVLDPKPSLVLSPGELKSTSELSEALGDLAFLYGYPIAKNVERIFRQETGNFTSGGYLYTGAAGMIPQTKTFPYGWGSMEKFWRDNPGAAPVGVVRFCVRGKIYPYLAFSNFNGLIPVAEKLKKYGNDPGRWNSNDPAAMAEYNRSINKITASLV